MSGRPEAFASMITDSGSQYLYCSIATRLSSGNSNLSLTISSKIIFYKIQIPIAIRQSLPAYGNEIILMMKGTSLASTVTIMDLTGVAKYIISTTFKPIEVFIDAGGIYLFMTFVIHNVIKFLEKKYSFN